MRKIRIKKTGGPLYDQNTNLSLNQGVNIEKQPEQTVNTTAKEVDRDEANVEAELGEIVFKPSSPQLLKIGGKPHSKGGTHLDLDPSDFIFSKFLKMDEPIAKNFETKKGTSYADAISKDVKPFNEAVHKLATTEDFYEKNSATFTSSAIMDKIKQLAFFQELQKGLPQGVPSFLETEENEQAYAKLGGLMKMQLAGSPFTEKEMKYGNKKVKAKEVKDKNNIPKQAKHVQSYSDGTDLYEETIPIKGKSRTPTSGGTFTDRDRDAIRGMLQRGEITPKELPKWVGYDEKSLAPYQGYYRPKGNNFQYYYTGNNVAPQTTPQTTPQGTSGTTPQTTPQGDTLPEVVVSSVRKLKKEDNNTETYQHNPIEVGYGFMDGVGMLSAAMTQINRYSPRKRAIKFNQADQNHVDYTGQRQDIEGQTKMVANQNNLLSPNASLASSRNAVLLSQSLNPLAESFANEQNTNVQIDNQFKQYNNQNLNQVQQLNENYADVYDTRVAQMNENFDAAKKFRMNDFLKQWQNAEAKRVAKNAENQLNQDYQVGTYGRIIRIVNPDGTLRRITGSTASNETKIPTFKQFMQDPRFEGLTPENLQKAYMQQYFGKSHQNFSAGIPEFS